MRLSRTLAAAALALIAFTPLRAETNIAKGIAHDLQHKLLTIRGLYRAENLQFSPDGTLLSKPEVSFGPADALFEFDKVEQKNGKLVLTGDLPTVFYDYGSDKTTFSRGRLKRVVTIELPGSDWASAMDSFWKVFYKPGEAVFEPCKREEAQAFHISQSNAPGVTPGQPPQKPPQGPVCLPTGERIDHRIGHGVTAPHATYDPDPPFPENARRKRLQGSTVLTAVIDPEGRTSAIMVIRPLGNGFDQEAVKTVHSWKFQPALLDGKPVPVLINIEVSFHLY